MDAHLQRGKFARARKRTAHGCMERPSQASIVRGERSTTEGDELGTAADEASIAGLIASHSGLASGERSGGFAIVQGRLTARRRHGVTLAFLDLAWSGHKVQLVVDCDGSEGGHLAPLGSIVRAGGTPGRTMRGELSLFCGPAAVELLQAAIVPAAGPQQPPSAPAPRFHVTPNNVRWGRALGLLGIGACNTLPWRGGTPLPLLTLTFTLTLTHATPTLALTPVVTLTLTTDPGPRPHLYHDPNTSYNPQP